MQYFDSRRCKPRRNALDFQPDYVTRAAPSSAPAESLHQAWPWREFGDQQRRRDIYAGFDYLRGNDDAVRTRVAGVSTEEFSAPTASFGGAEPAVSQTNVRVRTCQPPVALKCLPRLRGPLNRVEHDQRRPLLSATAVPVTLGYITSERPCIGKLNHFQGLDDVVPQMTTSIL